MMMSTLGPTAGTPPLGAAGTGVGVPVAGGSGSLAVPGGTAGTTVQAGNPAPGGTAGTSAAGSGVAGTAAAGGSGSVATAGTGVAGTAAGTGGAGTGGTVAAGTGGAAGSDAPAFMRPCVANGNEVWFIGDSYSDYAVAHMSLASMVGALAKKDGALMSSQNYRNLAVAGTTLAAAPAAIQAQWYDNKSMKPTKVVVMTGGGNDVLINNQQCRADGAEMQADCKMVVQASLDAAKAMFASMKEEGVSDVLYFWYPHIPGGLLTAYETGSTISDYTYPMLEELAKSASTDTFHVFMVPTVAIFEGHPEYFYSDGLHANDTGEGKIADAVWKVMKDNCIGQAATSMCCVP
jgi:lysophospholipase L1-like esterase